MAQTLHHVFAFADYVLVEADSTVKHEFLDGRLLAMAGGSPRHAAIAARVIAELALQLRGRPCEVFSSDLRIRVSATGLATYPDASVVCGSLELDPEDPKGHTIKNPRLIVEVLSPSTEEYDRGEKRAHYQSLPSLHELMLVSQDRRQIELWRRERDGWARHEASGAGALELTSVGCTLALEEIYREPLAP